MDRDTLYKKYAVDKLSTTDLGKKYNVTRHAISYWLKKFNINRRGGCITNSNYLSYNGWL